MSQGHDDSAYCSILTAFLSCEYMGAGRRGKIDFDSTCILPADPEKSAQSRNPRFGLSLSVRSVAQIIRFLGDLQYYQERVPKDASHNNPLTLGWAGVPVQNGTNQCPPEEGGCLFALNLTKGDTRFELSYRGHPYRVGEHDDYDHTLEVLSIVNQLINLNKSASDLKLTPYVQVVP